MFATLFLFYEQCTSCVVSVGVLTIRGLPYVHTHSLTHMPVIALEASRCFAAWGHFLLSADLHMAPHQEELNQCCCSLHVKLYTECGLAGLSSTHWNNQEAL